MKGKIFTTDEATKMLPLVRRIVTDAKACTKLIDRYERALTGDDEVSQELSEKLDRLQERLSECEKEAEDLGFFIDPALGVARFYGELESRIVFFTWQLGESAVSFWHPMEKSFADRQPLDDDEIVAENASGR